MGSVVPLLTATLSVAQGVASTSRNSTSLENLKAQQDLQERQAATNAALQKEQIALSTAQDDKDRKAALKRAVARQRASFGSAGVGSAAGSSQAVLLGLFEESEDEQRKREALDALKLKSIDQDLEQTRALNVLQRAQLEEKNNLNNVSTGIGVFGSLF